MYRGDTLLTPTVAKHSQAISLLWVRGRDLEHCMNFDDARASGQYELMLLLFFLADHSTNTCFAYTRMSPPLSNMRRGIRKFTEP